jgi:hypothetical protein
VLESVRTTERERETSGGGRDITAHKHKAYEKKQCNMQMFGAPDPEADTTEQSANTRPDTAKYKRRAHKHAR